MCAPHPLSPPPPTFARSDLLDFIGQCERFPFHLLCARALVLACRACYGLLVPATKTTHQNNHEINLAGATGLGWRCERRSIAELFRVTEVYESYRTRRGGLESANNDL